MKNLNHFEKTIILLILFAGILISLSQFIYNRSLWLDEAYLSLNIINKSIFELTKPLDFIQMAPILFLQIEKIFSELIPNSEFGLRLFPLISYLLSLFFFYKILKIIHKNYYTIIFSLSLFVFNATLIYYSSEVKQYMTDVLILTIIYYIILKNDNNQKHKYYSIGIAGIIGIFLTNISPIILLTVGFYLLFDIYQNNRKLIPYLIVIAFIWISTFFIYYILFIHNHPSRSAQIQEWTYYKAFMPINPLKKDFFYFFVAQWQMIFFYLLQFGKIVGICLFIFYLTGTVILIRKREIGIIILVITPMVLHLFLSSFKLYPFSLRTILYTLPCIIINCSFGFNDIIKPFFTNFKIEKFRLLAVFIPLIMVSIFYYKVGFPIKKNEIKKSIKFIEQNMHNGDKVYVNYLSRIPFQYYYDISFFKIDTNNIIIGQRTMFWNGRNWAADTIKYSNELSLLKGRTWILFTYVGDEAEKYKFLINYCAAKRINIIEEFHVKGSDVYLCDFSNRKNIAGS